MRLKKIIDAFILSAGLEALLLGKEVIASDGSSLGVVKKIEIDLSQSKWQMIVIDDFQRPKTVQIDDIRFLNRKIIRLRSC